MITLPVHTIHTIHSQIPTDNKLLVNYIFNIIIYNLPVIKPTHTHTHYFMPSVQFGQFHYRTELIDFVAEMLNM